MANIYGFSKIRQIEPEIFTDQDGRVELEILWLVCDDAIFTVDVLKGQTLEGLTARYKKTGYTDNQAIFYKSR
jgi:hypothetical protein